MVDPPGIERGRAPHDAVDLVSLLEEQLRQIAPVLARYSRNQRPLHGASFRPSRRYHSIVAASPSANGVVASKPNSFRARCVSSLRRGCPLGREVSQRTVPSKPQSRAMSSVSSLMVISKPAPRLTGSDES